MVRFKAGRLRVPSAFRMHPGSGRVKGRPWKRADLAASRASRARGTDRRGSDAKRSDGVMK
jgi:hypothetical protein